MGDYIVAQHKWTYFQQIQMSTDVITQPKWEEPDEVKRSDDLVTRQKWEESWWSLNEQRYRYPKEVRYIGIFSLSMYFTSVGGRRDDIVTHLQKEIAFHFYSTSFMFQKHVRTLYDQEDITLSNTMFHYNIWQGWQYPVQMYDPLQYKTKMTTSTSQDRSIIINDNPENIKSKSMFHSKVTLERIQQVQKHIPTLYMTRKT